MRTAAQIVFGLLVSLVGGAVLSDFGLMVPSPSRWDALWGWATLVALISVGQGLSAATFRYRFLVPVALGLLLLVALAFAVLDGGVTPFWEIEYPDGASPTTWRSYVLFFSLFFFAEGVTVWVWRDLKYRQRSKGGDS